MAHSLTCSTLTGDLNAVEDEVMDPIFLFGDVFHSTVRV